MNVCILCGKSSIESELIYLINPNDERDIRCICRHGHYDAILLDPFTGLPTILTGPEKIGRIPAGALLEIAAEENKL